MGLIEKLQEIKTKIENLPSGSDDFEIKDCQELFKGEMRIKEFDSIIKKIKKPTNMYCFSEGCSSTTVNADFSHVDFSDLTGDMQHIFCFRRLSDFKMPKGLENITSFNYSFDNLNRSELLDTVEVDLSMCDKVESFERTFFEAKVHKVKMNITNTTNMEHCFYDGYDNNGLTELDFTGTTNVKCNFNLKYTRMGRDNLMTMLNTLPTLDHSQTITLGETKINELSEADIAEFSSKGYSLTT